MTAPDGGPRGATSPAAMLADVIGRVAILGEKTSQLGSDLSEIAAEGATRGTQVEGLTKEVRALTQLVQQLAAEPEDEEDNELRKEAELPNWDKLNRQQTVEAWDRLYGWLDSYLVPVHEISVETLLPCWPFHHDVREQLSAARVAWVHAYRYQRPDRAVDWHQRTLPSLLKWLTGKAGGPIDHTTRPFHDCKLGDDGPRSGKHRFQWEYPLEINRVVSRTHGHAPLSFSTMWWHQGRITHIESRPVENPPPAGS